MAIRRAAIEAPCPAAENRLAVRIRTLAVVAAALLGSLSFSPASAADLTEALSTTPPCQYALRATRIPGDPNAAVVRTGYTPMGSGGTVTAYGATTLWSATVERFARVRWGLNREESSFVVRAPGPIEAVVFQPPQASCLSHAPISDRNAEDGPDVERPTVVAGNPESIGPLYCATRYAPPETLFAAQPRIPEIAMQQNITGAVRILVTIDDRGKPTRLAVVSSPSGLLNAAAMEAARGSTFRPETFRCHSVPGTYIFSVSYSSR